MTSEAGPLLDRAQVDDLVGLDQGQGAMFARFVALFRTSAPGRIARMLDHSDSGNLLALSEAAHSLRGAAGNVGAVRLSEKLRRVEAAAKLGDLALSRTLLASLEDVYSETERALIAACGAKE